MDSLGCKEPWKEYLRREVEWAGEALSRFSADDDDVPHRHTDLFRERKIRVTTAVPGRDRAESATTMTTEQDRPQQKWSYDVLKHTLTEVLVLHFSKLVCTVHRGRMNTD